MFWLLRRGCKYVFILLCILGVLAGGVVLFASLGPQPDTVIRSGNGQVIKAPTLPPIQSNAVIEGGQVAGFTLTEGQLITGNLGGCTNGALGTTPYAFRYEADGSFTETNTGQKFPGGTTKLTVAGCLNQQYAVVEVLQNDGRTAVVKKLDQPEAQ